MTIHRMGSGEGGYRVIFLSSDDDDATAPVAALAKQLGFAPVKLGKLNEGGALVHARGRIWGHAHLSGFIQEGAVIGVWAPFEERGGARRSGRSALRIYRLLSMA